jgi:hypothetical protein
MSTDEEKRLAELHSRLKLLIAAATDAAHNNTDITEEFSVPLRGKPVLTRKLVRNRIDHRSAVLYWREVRETELLIQQANEALGLAKDIRIVVHQEGPRMTAAEEADLLQAPVGQAKRTQAKP